MKHSKTRPRDFRLELDFRRAVLQVPRRERPGLRAWLRRYARTLRRIEPACRTPARHTRTFYELDPATGEWRRV